MSKKKIALCCFILLLVLCAGAALNERVAERREAHKLQALRLQSSNPPGTTFMPREYIRVVRQENERGDRPPSH